MTAGRESQRGIWHSLRWWTGHHHARSRCGEYAPHDGAACNRNAAGTGEDRLHRQLEAEHARHRASKPASRPARHGTRAQLRADTRTAQHAQQLRRDERGGYKTENAIFFGSSKHAAGDVTEHKITQAAADREARNRAEHDREQAAAHKAAGKPHWLYRPIAPAKARAEAAAEGW